MILLDELQWNFTNDDHTRIKLTIMSKSLSGITTFFLNKNEYSS